MKDTKEATVYLSDESMKMFKELCEEARIWDTNPFWTPELTKHQRGNMSDLSKKGLIQTEKSEDGLLTYFTDAGIEFAKNIGERVPERGW
jgi:hypothetical protein